MSTKRKGPDHAPAWFVYFKIALPAFSPNLLLCLLCFYLSYVIPRGTGMVQVYCSITQSIDLSDLYHYVSLVLIFSNMSTRNETQSSSKILSSGPCLKDCLSQMVALDDSYSLYLQLYQCHEYQQNLSNIV